MVGHVLCMNRITVAEVEVKLDCTLLIVTFIFILCMCVILIHEQIKLLYIIINIKFSAKFLACLCTLHTDFPGSLKQ